jgi:hypothetical protein
MPFIDPATCEPLRVFSRLEPRPRQPDFDRALRAELHDPLWLLARQWQFGEFKGEDAGSAVLAKVAMRVAQVGDITAAGQVWSAASDPIPLETHVERLPIAFDPIASADAGRVLLSLLDARGAEFDGLNPAKPYATERARYRDAFRRQYSFELPPTPDADPDRALAATRVRSNPRGYAAIAALAGRAVDGVALYRSLPAGPVSWSSLPATLALDIVPEHAELVRAAIEEFRDWFAATYPEPPLGADPAWNPSQLEYQFTARVPRPDGVDAILVADEYDSGRLDWYAFDLGPKPLGPALDAAADAGESVFSVIPTPAEFPGMPRPRWWQLEDGSIDLGNIRAAATDVAKVLVAEFALLYGNNWFVIPCRQTIGTLAEIEALVVTDVFGIRTLVRPVNQGSGVSWTAWDFFSLSRRETPGVPGSTVGAHLFLPAAASTVDEGEPVESVAFLRDEMSNMVWAVEARVADGLGRGRNGNDTARQMRNALVRVAEDLDRAAGVQAPEPQDGAAPLRYVLGTTVPENWIPLVPVHKPFQNRAIRLQRASMPRFFRGDVRPVRPITGILRTGLASDDRQLQPWFLEEEEVPREGAVVESSFQRTRWLSGRTVVWLGRRGRSGRGVGGSGLRYDLVEEVRQAQR